MLKGLIFKKPDPRSSEEQELDDLGALVDQAPAVRVTDLIISQAIEEGSSEIRLVTKPEKADFEVKYLKAGQESPVMSPPLSIYPQIRAHLAEMAGLDPQENRLSNQGSYTYEYKGRPYKLSIILVDLGLTIRLQ